MIVKRTGRLLVMMLFFSLLFLQIPCYAKGNQWEWDGVQEGGGVWSKSEKANTDGDVTHRTLFVSGNDLLTGIRYQGILRESVPKLTEWKMRDQIDELRIVTARGNYVYVQLYADEGMESKLYKVHVDTGKKKKISDKFYAFPSTKKYIYASDGTITDTGAYPWYVWKFTGSSAKRIKKLGDHVTEPIRKGKYIYYGKYKGSSQKKVTVYRAKTNGKNAKKLFKAGIKGEYVQTLLQSVSRKYIKVNSSCNFGKSVQFVYNMKTKKLKKKVLS